MRRTAPSKTRARLACGRKPIPSSRSTTSRSRGGDSMNARRTALTLLAIIIVAGVSCGRRDADSASSSGGEVTPSVVVYCSADKEFAELIFHAYEAKTGVKILPLYDTEETKTAGLTARLVAEKMQPKADV